METISISSDGTAIATFDGAEFNLEVKGTGKTGPRAKANTRVVMNRIYQTVKGLENEGAIFDQDRTKSSLAVEMAYKRTPAGQVFDGYLARFKIALYTEKMDKISTIHDALTSIEDAEVQSPTFKLNDIQKNRLQFEAFKKAVTLGKDRFEMQARALGFDPDDFEIDSWVVYYNATRGRSFKNCVIGDANESVAVKAGKADVSVTLTTEYIRKPGA